MQIPSASPSLSFNSFSTASLIFAFWNAVAKNFAEPSGSSPALNPPGNMIICACPMAFSNSATDPLISSASRLRNTFVITFAPARSNARLLSYSQFVPGKTGIKTVGCPILWLQIWISAVLNNFSSISLSESAADFVANTFSRVPVHARSASFRLIVTSPYASTASPVTAPISV